MVFSSVALLDPALTAVLSWLCGIEALPTMYSWLGGGTVIVGVAIVSVAESQEEEAAAAAAAITAAELEQETKERIRAYGETRSQSLSHVTNQRGVVDDDSFEDSSCHPLTSHCPHAHPHKGNDGDELRTIRDHEHTRSYIEEDDANSYRNSLTSSSHATIFNPVLPQPAAVVASNSKRQLKLLPPPSDSDEDIGDVTPFRHNSYAHTRQYRSTQTPLAAKAQLSSYEALHRDSETSAPCDNPSLDAHLEMQHGGDGAHEPSAM